MSSAIPSTAVTTRAVPRKIRVPSGSRISVPAPLLGIGAAELVEVGLELVAPRIELELQLRETGRGHLERTGDGGRPLVPGVEGVMSRRHGRDGERAVARRLGVPGIVP